MLLGYANATPRGLEFLDFLDDEHTYKTLFVPVDEGFADNMVTGSVGSTGPDSACCAWSTTAVLCPQTLSGPDLELHASNTTFLPERKNENWGYQCCFCDCFSCFQSGMSLQGAKMQFFFLMENE